MAIDEREHEFIPCDKDIYAVIDHGDGAYTVPVIGFEIRIEEFGDGTVAIPVPLLLGRDGEVNLPEERGDIKRFDGEGFVDDLGLKAEGE